MDDNIRQFPRVLVVAIGRINTIDSYNNGLLLRNLFHGWPKEKIAQIYSSGDNGDEGFFGNYYKVDLQDRRFGGLFCKFKSVLSASATSMVESKGSETRSFGASIRALVKRWFVDTGLYELVFPVRVSKNMEEWVNEFSPDVILAQGYSLSFARLPVLLKQLSGSKIAFFCSDDWPSYLYSGTLGEPLFFAWFMRRCVASVMLKLITATDIPIAFGNPMASEYEKRYGKPFGVVSHSDEPARFCNAKPVRVHPQDVVSIAMFGTFNSFRAPLLADIEESCHLLGERGAHVRIAVFSSAICQEGWEIIRRSKYLDVYPDPGNDSMPRVIKGADILLLAECFAPKIVHAIGLSVSSKSHLFMLGAKPIIVYSHPDTGVAKYASSHGWGVLVSSRNIVRLSEAIYELVLSVEHRMLCANMAYRTGLDLHDRNLVCRLFRELLVRDLTHELRSR